MPQMTQEFIESCILYREHAFNFMQGEASVNGSVALMVYKLDKHYTIAINVGSSESSMLVTLASDQLQSIESGYAYNKSDLLKAFTSAEETVNKMMRGLNVLETLQLQRFFPTLASQKQYLGAMLQSVREFKSIVNQTF